MTRHMTRLLPFPWLSGGLLVLWLLLNQTLAVGHFLLGGAFALAGPWVMAALVPERPRIRRPGAILRLSLRVLIDITQSNIAVARIILLPAPRPRSAGFVRIPLRLRDPCGLAVLACIITATPGTLWADYDSAKSILTIHVLDLVDEDEWIRTIKQRYEQLLLEIFQ